MLPEEHGAVVGNRLIIEGQQHIPFLKDLGRSCGGRHLADEEALLLRPHAVGLSKMSILHRLDIDAQRREARVLLVTEEVVQEVHDHHRGYDIAYVFRLVGSQALESHAKAFASTVEGWTTTVPAVDGRIYLYPQEFGRCLRICHHLHPRDHPTGDTDGVATNGKANTQYRLLKVWNLLAKLNHLDPIPELLVLHPQHRTVALPAHGLHGGQMLRVAAAALHFDLRTPFDTVRVRQDYPLLPRDAETGPAGAELPLSLPGQREVRHGVHAPDLHDSVEGNSEAFEAFVV
mmetsp:Transcript_90968/g.199253  ORF Transcript_90968/g.199253 Transcript_90968/m.199253 type:complete len:289 (-) Transcript_90968:40-906(-)